MPFLLTICIPVLRLTKSIYNDIVSLWSANAISLAYPVNVIICAKSVDSDLIYFIKYGSLTFTIVEQLGSESGIYGAMNQVLSLSNSNFICYMGVGDYLQDLQGICSYLYPKRGKLDIIVYIVPHSCICSDHIFFLSQ